LMWGHFLQGKRTFKYRVKRNTENYYKKKGKFTVQHVKIVS